MSNSLRSIEKRVHHAIRGMEVGLLDNLPEGISAILYISHYNLNSDLNKKNGSD